MAKLRQMACAAALLLGVPGLALAQGTAPTANTTGDPQTAPTVLPSSPAVHNPAVNPDAAGTIMPQRHSGNSRITGPGAGDDALRSGANSFTEGQARRRIEDHGYMNVGRLHKDQNSIWQAEASKDGRRVRVGVDYRGNVVEEK